MVKTGVDDSWLSTMFLGDFLLHTPGAVIEVDIIVGFFK
jgi:hypothetical protein